MKNFFFIVPILFVQTFSFAQKPYDIISIVKSLDTKSFTISVTLYDKNTKEPIIFANVTIYNKDLKIITGTETDFDGKYQLPNLKPGKYILEASYIGHTTTRVENVLLRNTDLISFDILINEGEVISCGGCLCYKVPLIDMSNPSYITTFTSSDISNRY